MKWLKLRILFRETLCCPWLYLVSGNAKCSPSRCRLRLCLSLKCPVISGSPAWDRVRKTRNKSMQSKSKTFRTKVYSFLFLSIFIAVRKSCINTNNHLLLKTKRYWMALSLPKQKRTSLCPLLQTCILSTKLSLRNHFCHLVLWQNSKTKRSLSFISGQEHQLLNWVTLMSQCSSSLFRRQSRFFQRQTFWFWLITRSKS